MTREIGCHGSDVAAGVAAELGLEIIDLRGIEWAIFDAEGLTKPRIT
jgi:hypothetical protein